LKPDKSHIMNRKNLLLLALIFLGSFATTNAQLNCPPNIDFELGNNSYWNYWRGQILTGPIWNLVTCAPDPTYHMITSGSSCTDYYGGFPCVGDGFYSLRINKDTTDQNADAADYHVHVPSGVAFSLIYRYAIVLQNPPHSPSQQPRFQIDVTDSATGTAVPCNSFSFVSSSSLPGFSASTVASGIYYKPWTAASLDLTGLGGHTVIVSFKAGACSLGGHFGYAYIDLNCGIFKIQTVGCSGGLATLTAPPGYSAYNWTDSLTYSKSYGSTQTVVVGVPTITTTYAVILTPYTGYGCTDTLYARLVPSNMVTHQSHDTSLCVGGRIKMWGGATDILPLTYSWTPSTGLSCSSCDTTFVTPPVGVNQYMLTTTNTGGCLQVDTITVTVYPIPKAISGNLNACLGYTTGLSDTVTGGTWSSSNLTVATIGSSTGIVTAKALGTSSITYSFHGLCPAVTTITVQPLPLPITGVTQTCVSYTTILSDASGTGTWTSGNTTIAITSGGISSHDTITGMSASTAMITFALSTTGCFTSIPVTVIALPNPITGLSPICEGPPGTILNDLTTGGVWTSSNTGIAAIAPGGGGGGGSNELITGKLPGTATISYTIGSGCFVTFPMTIWLTPTAVIGTPNLCQGSTETVSDGTSGGTWTSSDHTVATVAGTTVSGVGPGTSIIAYVLPTGCQAAMTITVSPLPTAIAGVNQVCLGQTTGLSDALTGGTWVSSNTNAIIGSTSGLVFGNALGSSTITYTSGAGCSVTGAVTVNANPTNIIGTKVFCAGTTSCLSDATLGGTWSCTPFSVATVGVPTSGCVFGNGPGTATLTYTMPSGCYALTTLTVNPLPGAISPAPVKVCVGLTDALTDITSGGTWSSSSANATVGSSTGIVTGITGGTATISYTLTTGCYATVVASVNAAPTPILGATTVCVSATTGLTDATLGGSWSFTGSTISATTTSGVYVVTGLSAGTATVTYTSFTTGCFTTTVVTVGPAPGPIGGSLFTVCPGAKITLSDAITGGGWVSAGPGIGSIDPSTGVVTGVSSGTASITYSLGGSCKVSKTVTVLTMPKPITGNTNICVGASSLLSDITTPVGTWSSLPTSVATMSGATVTGAGVGTATVSYTIANSCAATTVVTVNPIPTTIIGKTNVCVGGTSTLSDAMAGGTWSTTSGAIAGIGSTTGILSGNTVGTTTVTYKLTSTGCYISTPVTVNPLPAPVAGPTQVCIGSSILLSDFTTGGTWSSPSTTIAITPGGSVTAGATPGTATVVYTLPTGCTASAVITINGLPPVVTGPSAVCIGASILLSDAGGPGTWASLAPATATVTPGTGVVTGVALGTAPIVFTLTSTGCSRNTSVTVSPTPKAITGPITLCVNTAVSLSDAISGGTWTSMSPSVGTIDGTTGSFYGITTGTSTVSYSLGGSCAVSTIMTVNPLPPAITGGGPLCLTQTLTLSDASTVVGTWVSSDPTVATVVPSGLTTALVTPGGTIGTAVITYSVGCYVTTTVTVTPSPGPIFGTATVCQGLTTTLNDVVGGGTWYTSNSAVATVPSGGSVGTIYGNAAGTATISYTLGGTCQAAQTVTVYPVGVISGGPDVCTGHSIPLTSTVPFGTWISGSTSVATITLTGGSVTGVTPGSAPITYTLPSGCVSNYTVNVSSSPNPITGTPQVCKGQTTTFSDAGGGTWTSSSAFVGAIDPVSGVYTGINAGSATVTYNLSAGCISTTPVTVEPLPNAITSSSANLCALSTVTVSCSSPGGTWSVAPGSLVTIGATSGVVTAGAVSGAATVTYTLPTGCSSTKVLTINPLPAAITGPASVCVGNPATFTNPGTGTWSSSFPAIATITSGGVATGVSAGGTNIIFTAATTGCQINAPLVVVPPPSSIIAPGAVCVAQPGVILSDAVSGGVWTSGDTTLATINPSSGAMNILTSGTLLISYSAGSGCIKDTVIIINPISPIIGSNIVCVGQTTVFVDTTLGGTWSSSSPSKASVGIGTGYVTGVAAGSAVIAYTTPKGCIATLPVAVNPVPSAIVGNPQICLGLTQNYNDGVTGGTWSSAVPLIASISGSVPAAAATGNTLGSTTISYTVGGCSATKQVTVNPMPTVTYPTTNVCVGQPLALVGSGTGSWSSSAPTIATVGATSGIVTGVRPGVATIVFLSAAGCSVPTNITVLPNPSVVTGVNTVCVNASTALFSATPGGSWSSVSPSIASIIPPSTSSPGIVQGNIAGTAVIQYTIPTGCFSQTTVTVDPLPASFAGTSPADICQGTSYVFTDTDPGGTWSSSVPAVATIGVTSGRATGIAPGSTFISYTFKTTGCSISSMLTIDPAPSAIIGQPSICLGAAHTTTFFDGTTPGSWSSSPTSIATVDASGNVTGVALGTAIISYTSSFGCSVTSPLTVTPTPAAIIGNINVCYGSSYAFTDMVPGGSWSSSAPGIASVSSTGTVTGVSLGAATIYYSMSSGCDTFINITVQPLPTNTFVVTGGGTMCSTDAGVHVGLNGSSTGVNYLLYVGTKIATGPIPGTGGPIDFGLQKVVGTYTVIGTNTLTGCSSTMTGSVNIIVIPTVVPTINLIAAPGDTVCAGSSTTFSSSITHGGVSPAYTWAINGTVVAHTTGYAYMTPHDGDVVVVTLVSDTVCAIPSTVSSSVTMKVLDPMTPTATLTADPGDTVCQGLPVTLKANPSFGGTSPSYTWFVNGASVGFGSTFTFVPNNKDIVYTSMVSNYPCLVTKTVPSNKVQMTVDSAQIPHVSIGGSTSAAPGQTITLTANVTSGGPGTPSYQWFVDGKLIVGATNSTYPYLAPSAYTSHEDSVSVTVTSTGMCTMTSHQWVYMSMHNLGVNQVNNGSSDISVLPNPSKGEFTVKGSLGTTNDQDVSLEMTDLLGQVVYRNNVVAHGGNINLNVTLSKKLANGMYILSIHSDNANQIFHLVIEQ